MFASLGRDVSQDDIDTLQTAADDSGAGDVVITAINKSFRKYSVLRPADY